MKTILHIGTHKTGTSAMQAFLSKHRPHLLSHDLHYPSRKRAGEPETTAHNFLALALSSGRSEELDSAVSFLDNAILSASDGQTLLLSGEEFNRYVLAPDGVRADKGQAAMQAAYFAGDESYWDGRRAYLTRLKDILGPLEPELWITLRRPDDFCASMYQQVVRMRRYTKTITEFAASNFPLFDYARQLDLWSEFFPRIRVSIYEDDIKAPGGCVAATFDRLGVPLPESASDATRFLNTASHPHMIDFLRLTNHFHLRKLAMRKNLTKWSNAANDPMFAERWDLLSLTERQGINGRYAKANEAIRKRFDVPVHGRDTLFPAEIADKGAKYPGLTMAQFEKLAVAADVPDWESPKKKRG